MIGYESGSWLSSFRSAEGWSHGTEGPGERTLVGVVKWTVHGEGIMLQKAEGGNHLERGLAGTLTDRCPFCSHVGGREHHAKAEHLGERAQVTAGVSHCGKNGPVEICFLHPSPRYL